MNAQVIGAIDVGGMAVDSALGFVPGGALAGPIVKDLLGKVFPGPSVTWQNVPPEVHAWCTKNASWALVDWIRAKFPDQFATIDKVRAANVLFAFETKRNIVGTPGGEFPEAADLPKVYATIGIDYAATKAKIEAAGWHGNVKDSEIVYLPNSSNPVVQKVTQLADAANKSLPPNQSALVTAKAKAITKAFDDQPGSTSISPALLIGGAALLFFILKK